MSLITKAYAAPAPKQALGPFEISRREPGPRDVLLDIQYCGVCHSDIHSVRGEWGDAAFPMVPGHEIVGTVTQVGDRVKRFKPSDRVGVGCFVMSCRECPPCLAGEEQYCERVPVFTYNARDVDGSPSYGGYSTRITVNEDYVLRLPEKLAMDRAAPLLCAGITTYSPLKRWGAGPGKKVGILGLGGLGHMGVKLADAMGAEVTVLSHSAKKKEDALRLGADHFVNTSEPGAFASLANRFDLILNTVSVELDWNQYLNLLRHDGTMVLLGVPPHPVPVHASNLIMKRHSLAGSLIGGIAETQEMLDFCEKHGIGADIELIPIERINEAYDRTVNGDVRYRFVIDIKSLG